MKWIFALALSLAVLVNVHGAGPDDQYLEIYSLIQQADGLTHDPQTAAARYIQAQNALKKLQTVYPRWQTDVIQFRLDYVAEKLAAAQKTISQSTAPALGTETSAPPVAPKVQTPQGQIADLNDQIQTLVSEKTALERKLKEALSVQPATIDPSEMAKAQQTITALKKERDLLAISLEQAKSVGQTNASPTEQKQAPTGLEQEQTQTVKNLVKDRAALLDYVSALEKTVARLKTQASLDQAAFEKKLAETAQTPPEAEVKSEQKTTVPGHSWFKSKSSEQKATNQPAVQATTPTEKSNKKDQAQIAQLRARIAILEAKPLPYTSEEMAMIKQANAKPIADSVIPAPTPKKAVRSIKDLPAGAGALMAEAQRAFMTGDFITAETKFTEVLRQDENNVYVLTHLASAQLSAGHDKESEKSVHQALALDPEDAGSLFLLGNLRLRQDKLDEALDALSRSAVINPTNAATQNSLGGVLSQKGLREPAEAALRKALQLDPSYPEAHHNLAIVYATQKPPFLELARWHYNKALALGHPKNSELEKILDAK